MGSASIAPTVSIGSSETPCWRAQVFQHIGRERERQALSAKVRRPGNRVPALLDKGAVGSAKPSGRVTLPSASLRLRIALAVERRPFTGGELADPFDNRLDHVGLAAAKRSLRGEFGDAGVDLHGEELIGSGGVKSMARFSLAFASFRAYSGSS
jgi:hypothetical protein